MSYKTCLLTTTEEIENNKRKSLEFLSQIIKVINQMHLYFVDSNMS